MPIQGGAETHDLGTLEAFHQAASNWAMVGDTWADPEETHHLQAIEGEDVLVNRPTGEARDNLRSRIEHGDADLEFEFMMARGSNSGVYLQGRYEIQLLDSWGVDQPRYSDCGGVYQRRRADGTQFEGAAPRMNVCKAPGLWQKMRIAFQAPRFGDDGQKSQNAKLLFVEINGVMVHQNLELSGPTGGAISDEEVAAAPLMIQGDHGPVAFRNVRLHRYDAPLPTLDLNYRVHYNSVESPLEEFHGLAERQADTEGRVALLTHEVSRFSDGFAILFDGTLEVASRGNFEFDFHHIGIGWLRIDGNPVFDPEEHFYLPEARRALASLEPGRHRFEAGYLKKGKLDWQQAARPELALFVRGPGFREVALHRVGGLAGYVVDPIFLDAETPRVVRSFADVSPQKGTSERVMHAINVGSPGQLHYTLDYKQGTLLRAWRGEFLDATPMWHQRGDGSSRPRGAEEFLTVRPLVARLEDDRAPWPDPYAASGVQSVSYRIDASGLPVFHYRFEGVDVEDAPRAMEGKRIERRLTLSEPSPNLYFLLAEAASIELVKPGLYAADDRRYYIRVRKSERTLVRDSDGGAQLLATPDSDNALVYEILF